LIDMIDAETTKPIAVFAHHPPFEAPEGPDPVNFETPKMMARLRQALHHSERVVAVFSGHVHRGTVGHVGCIPATVTPCHVGARGMIAILLPDVLPLETIATALSEILVSLG
jgi:hypothetical protein